MLIKCNTNALSFGECTIGSRSVLRRIEVVSNSVESLEVRLASSSPEIGFQLDNENLNMLGEETGRFNELLNVGHEVDSIEVHPGEAKTVVVRFQPASNRAKSMRTEYVEGLTRFCRTKIFESITLSPIPAGRGQVDHEVQSIRVSAILCLSSLYVGPSRDVIFHECRQGEEYSQEILVRNRSERETAFVLSMETEGSGEDVSASEFSFEDVSTGAQVPLDERRRLTRFGMATMRIVYRPQREDGRRMYQAKIFNTENAQETITLNIHAVVVGNIDNTFLKLSCGDLIDFGECYDGELCTQHINLTNMSHSQLEVSIGTFPPVACVRVTAYVEQENFMDCSYGEIVSKIDQLRIESVTVDPGRQRRFSINFFPRLVQEQGHDTDILSLRKRVFSVVLTGKSRDGKGEEGKAPFQKIVRCLATSCTSVVSVTPRELDYGTFIVGEVGRAPFTLTNNSEMEAHVVVRYTSKVLKLHFLGSEGTARSGKEPVVSGPNANYRFSIPARANQRFELEFAPRRENKEYQKKIVFTNLRNPENESVLKVRAVHIDKHRIAAHNRYYKIRVPAPVMGSSELLNTIKVGRHLFGNTAVKLFSVENLTSESLELEMESRAEDGVMLAQLHAETSPIFRKTPESLPLDDTLELPDLRLAESVSASPQGSLAQSLESLDIQIPLRLKKKSERSESSNSAHFILDGVKGGKKASGRELPLRTHQSAKSISSPVEEDWQKQLDMRRRMTGLEEHNMEFFENLFRQLQEVSLEELARLDEEDESGEVKDEVIQRVMESEKLLSSIKESFTTAAPTLTLSLQAHERRLVCVLLHTQLPEGGVAPKRFQKLSSRLLIRITSADTKMLQSIEGWKIHREFWDGGDQERISESNISTLKSVGFPTRMLIVEAEACMAMLDVAQKSFSFGVLKRHEKRVREIVLNNNCEQPLIYGISRPRSIAGGDVTITGDLGCIPGFSSRNVAFEYTPRLAGNVSIKLELKTLSLQDATEIPIKLKAKVVNPPKFVVSPTTLNHSVFPDEKTTENATFTTQAAEKRFSGNSFSLKVENVSDNTRNLCCSSELFAIDREGSSAHELVVFFSMGAASDIRTEKKIQKLLEKREENSRRKKESKVIAIDKEIEGIRARNAQQVIQSPRWFSSNIYFRLEPQAIQEVKVAILSKRDLYKSRSSQNDVANGELTPQGKSWAMYNGIISIFESWNRDFVVNVSFTFNSIVLLDLHSQAEALGKDTLLATVDVVTPPEISMSTSASKKKRKGSLSSGSGSGGGKPNLVGVSVVPTELTFPSVEGTPRTITIKNDGDSLVGYTMSLIYEEVRTYVAARQTVRDDSGPIKEPVSIDLPVGTIEPKGSIEVGLKLEDGLTTAASRGRIGVLHVFVEDLVSNSSCVCVVELKATPTPTGALVVGSELEGNRAEVKVREADNRAGQQARKEGKMIVIEVPALKFKILSVEVGKSSKAQKEILIDFGDIHVPYLAGNKEEESDPVKIYARNASETHQLLIESITTNIPNQLSITTTPRVFRDGAKKESGEVVIMPQSTIPLFLTFKRRPKGVRDLRKLMGGIKIIYSVMGGEDEVQNDSSSGSRIEYEKRISLKATLGFSNLVLESLSMDGVNIARNKILGLYSPGDMVKIVCVLFNDGNLDSKYQFDKGSDKSLSVSPDTEGILRGNERRNFGFCIDTSNNLIGKHEHEVKMSGPRRNKRGQKSVAISFSYYIGDSSLLEIGGDGVIASSNGFSLADCGLVFVHGNGLRIASVTNPCTLTLRNPHNERPLRVIKGDSAFFSLCDPDSGERIKESILDLPANSISRFLIQPIDGVLNKRFKHEVQLRSGKQIPVKKKLRFEILSEDGKEKILSQILEVSARYVLAGTSVQPDRVHLGRVGYTSPNRMESATFSVSLSNPVEARISFLAHLPPEITLEEGENIDKIGKQEYNILCEPLASMYPVFTLHPRRLLEVAEESERRGGQSQSTKVIRIKAMCGGAFLADHSVTVVSDVVHSSLKVPSQVVLPALVLPSSKFSTVEAIVQNGGAEPFDCEGFLELTAAFRKMFYVECTSEVGKCEFTELSRRKSETQATFRANPGFEFPIQIQTHSKRHSHKYPTAEEMEVMTADGVREGTIEDSERYAKQVYVGKLVLLTSVGEREEVLIFSSIVLEQPLKASDRTVNLFLESMEQDLCSGDFTLTNTYSTPLTYSIDVDGLSLKELAGFNGGIRITPSTGVLKPKSTTHVKVKVLGLVRFSKEGSQEQNNVRISLSISGKEINAFSQPSTLDVESYLPPIPKALSTPSAPVATGRFAVLGCRDLMTRPKAYEILFKGDSASGEGSEWSAQLVSLSKGAPANFRTIMFGNERLFSVKPARGSFSHESPVTLTVSVNEMEWYGNESAAKKNTAWIALVVSVSEKQRASGENVDVQFIRVVSGLSGPRIGAKLGRRLKGELAVTADLSVWSQRSDAATGATSPLEEKIITSAVIEGGVIDSSRAERMPFWIKMENISTTNEIEVNVQSTNKRVRLSSFTHPGAKPRIMKLAMQPRERLLFLPVIAPKLILKGDDSEKSEKKRKVGKFVRERAEVRIGWKISREDSNEDSTHVESTDGENTRSAVVALKWYEDAGNTSGSLEDDVFEDLSTVVCHFRLEDDGKGKLHAQPEVRRFVVPRKAGEELLVWVKSESELYKADVYAEDATDLGSRSYMISVKPKIDAVLELARVAKDDESKIPELLCFHDVLPLLLVRGSGVDSARYSYFSKRVTFSTLPASALLSLPEGFSRLGVDLTRIRDTILGFVAAVILKEKGNFETREFVVCLRFATLLEEWMESNPWKMLCCDARATFIEAANLLYGIAFHVNLSGIHSNLFPLLLRHLRGLISKLDFSSDQVWPGGEMPQYQHLRDLFKEATEYVTTST